MHFTFLYVGESGPLGEGGLDEGGGCRYIRKMNNELSNFAWFEPVESCTAAAAVRPVDMEENNSAAAGMAQRY